MPAAPKPPHTETLPHYRAWIRLQPCVVPGCRRRPIHACHLHTKRGAGDVANLFPACWLHHLGDQHTTMGVRVFQLAYGLDLPGICTRLWYTWLEGESFLP